MSSFGGPVFLSSSINSMSEDLRSGADLCGVMPIAFKKGTAESIFAAYQEAHAKLVKAGLRPLWLWSSSILCDEVQRSRMLQQNAIMLCKRKVTGEQNAASPAFSSRLACWSDHGSVGFDTSD